MSRIGIDFGTTFCSASRINPKTGLSEAVTFRHTGDNQKIPSMVHFPEDGEPEVGKSVYNQVASEANYDAAVAMRTVKSLKRMMDQNGRFLGFSHTNIITIIIRHVVDEAIRAGYFDKRPDEVVLTYPVHFREWQKEMLKTAASNAGFAANKVYMMPEPVSAAMAYVKQMADNQSRINGLLVYDFGGGTFDLAYVHKDRHGHFGIEQLDCKGLPDCGGDDVDNIFYDTWAKRVQREYHRNISQYPRERNVPFLLRCRKHKEGLSDYYSKPSKTPKRISELLPPIPGLPLTNDRWDVDKGTFDSMVDAVVDRTIVLTSEMLNEIANKRLPLDAVLLVGGSSRLPQVRTKISSLIDDGVTVYETGQMDTLVAQGAMYYDEYMGMKKNVSAELNTKYSYCIRCGNKLEPHHRFCQICGNKRYEG